MGCMNGALGVHWDDLPLLRARAASLLLSGPAGPGALAAEILSISSGPRPLAANLVREVLGADPRFQSQQDEWLLCDGMATYGSSQLRELDFVIVDVEATGGSPLRGDRLTEVAAVRVSHGHIVDSFESLVNPERPIPPTVSALTNITDEMVSHAPRFVDLAESLRDALEGAVFVAHNVSFDWRFLDAEFQRCSGARLGGERVCTLRLARRLHPELSRRSLRVLADYYAIAPGTWHRAGPDARVTAELFVRFLDRLTEQGVLDWARLQDYLKGEHRAAEDEEEGGRET